MKACRMSAYRIFPTLCLTALCLGSARIATAASVTGGGAFLPGTTEAVSVWARMTPGAPEGNIQFFAGLANGPYLVAAVVDLEVDSNVAIVTGVITQSVHSDYVGLYLVVRITDNGPSGDLIQWTVVSREISPDFGILGNFVVIDAP
jgi:hypothetical protein